MKTLPLLLKMPMRNPHHPHRTELKTTIHHRHHEDAEVIEVRVTEVLTPPE
jgi:hypothetical protein